ncbi:MAG: hypothetical protein RRY04_06460 [Oscillospiraceae bacterium]
MKKVKFALTLLAPSVLILLYFGCNTLARNYADQTYVTYPAYAVTLLGNLIIGLYLLMICKQAFTPSSVTAVHLEYPLGIALLLILGAVSLFSRSPYLGQFTFFILACIPQLMMLATVSIGAFVIELIRKHKQPKIN